MENGAFAPKEQMLHFPYFQINDISKVSKDVIMEYRVKMAQQIHGNKTIAIIPMD